MVYPDFLTWAQNIITKAMQYGTAEMEIEQGLKEAFTQGMSLGFRKGYEEGKDSEWWKEQDKGACAHGVDFRSIYPCVKCSRVPVTPKETEH